MDLVASGTNATGKAYVHLGNGNGSFGSTLTYNMETTSSDSVTLGDLNGDGFLDLVTVGQGVTGVATVRLGAGNGTFGTATSYVTGDNQSFSLALGDLNGDGVIDLLTGDDVGSGSGSVSVLLASMTSGISPLLSFKLTSRADALQALSQFSQARNRLSTQRGIIGGFQSRIGVAVNVLQVSSENYKAAESRILDADMAQESADLVRTRILQKAASAVLAQANQQPALTLRLLRT